MINSGYFWIETILLLSARHREDKNFQRLRRRGQSSGWNFRIHSLIERGRDEYGKIEMSVFGSQLWLNIQIHKSSKQIEDKHQSKPESHYRSWVMAAEMVACRYRNVLYHGIKKERVDVIVYRERGFKEPWFLLVPPDSEDLLPTELVIDWYRTRMRIEVSFRDFKSWLGVRGLHLKVRRTKRFSRLLAALAIGYILLLALGSSQLGQQLRQEVEILRRRARYGTRRTLSVLSIALMVMTDSFLLSRSNLVCILASCVLSLRHGQAFLSLLPN